MFCFRDVYHFILEGRRLCVSKHHNDYVRDEIYFKEIVSNTRLDLNHLSFTYLVYEFLIIYKFLLTYTVSIYYFYLSHLFVLLFIFRHVCYSFYLITKQTVEMFPTISGTTTELTPLFSVLGPEGHDVSPNSSKSQTMGRLRLG